MDKDLSQLNLDSLGLMPALLSNMAGSANKIEAFADEKMIKRLSRYDP